MLDHLDNKVKSETCIILLHGFGANKYDLYSLKELFPQTRVISFEAPLDLSPIGYFGGRAWFSLDFSPSGITYNTDEAEEALDTLKEEFELRRKDFKNLIVCGFSQGSILAHGLLLRNPGLLDAAICLSGRYSEFVFENADIEHLKNFPLFISHGSHDEVIPLESGQQIIKYYKETEANLYSKVYQMAHEISPECQKDVYEWFRDLKL